MRAKQIFEYALVELNKREAPSLLLEDYNYFINKAINQFVNKSYNIYDIKKGYNPEILELLGEFDYVINKPKYNLYKFILWAYKISKKIRN